jgi:hypothetical protein
MKLLRIISEIRQGPSPELVDKIDTEIFDEASYRNNHHDKTLWRKRSDILQKFGWKPVGFERMIDWLRSLKPETLLELYKALLQLRNDYIRQ